MVVSPALKTSVKVGVSNPNALRVALVSLREKRSLYSSVATLLIAVVMGVWSVSRSVRLVASSIDQTEASLRASTTNSSGWGCLSLNCDAPTHIHLVNGRSVYAFEQDPAHGGFGVFR
ncbi:MAG UNVERIFIED_CONTAM: hypothetical protein LVT10_09940 [Anaerolineae bacterium]